MTPRSGLNVALVGLVMTVLCVLPLLLLRLFEDSIPPSANDNLIAYAGIILVDLGLALGLIVLAMGLVMAGVLALIKHAGKPS